MRNIIYGLRDPRNDVYVYVGKSTVGLNRPLQHLTKSHNEGVNKWVRELRKKNREPIVDIIEIVENIDDLSNREKHWINYYGDVNPYILNRQLTPPPIVQYRTIDTDNELFWLCKTLSKASTIIKRERIFRNISQEELAKEADVARSTLSLFEKGENTSILVVIKMANFLSKKEIRQNIIRKRSRHKSKGIG